MTDENQNSDGEEPLIDPDVKEELEDIPGEDPMLVEYASRGKDDREEISFAGDWFPDSDDWMGKTNITPEQARPLALVRLMPDMFDELEDLRPLFEDFVNDYEKYLTSIEGEAREQQAGILQSMFGNESGLEEATTSLAMQAFSKESEEE